MDETEKKKYTMLDVLLVRKSTAQDRIKREEHFLAKTSCKFVEERRRARRVIEETQIELAQIEKDIEFEHRLEKKISGGG